MNAPRKASKLIRGSTGDWEIVIGLEVHAQVTSQSKLFSGASTAFGGEPNSHVSLVDAAMPGMLPVINEECVRQAVRTGFGLKARINLKSVFDRKNYFYPDLPQGYQISQYKSPVVGEGEVVVDIADGEAVTVGIERLHLEQDAGKSLHDRHPTMSFVDLNRAGVALMEIVSRPDLRSADEAKAYVAKLRTILRYLGTCDGDMEKGSLRADVNVSVRKPGARARHPLRDQERQFDPLHRPGDRATRRAARSKSWRTAARSSRRRGCSTRGRARRAPCATRRRRTTIATSPIPTSCRSSSRRTTSTISRRICRSCRTRRRYASRATTASPPMTPAFSSPNARRPTSSRRSSGNPTGPAATPRPRPIGSSTSSPGGSTGRGATSPPRRCRRLNSAPILDLIAAGTISGKIAKDLFEIVWSEGGDPHAIVEARGMKQVTDLSAIEKVVDDIIAKNPDKVEQAKAKPALVGWFVGQVMKSSGGKANPQAVNELLKSKLGL